MQDTKIQSRVGARFLGFLSIVVCISAYAADGDAYAQYHYPSNRRSAPPATNQTARPKPPPAETPQKFKDLAVDTEFYYPADKDHKMFPWVKISATSARSVPSAAKPTATVTTVPAETQVFVKSGGARKGDKEPDKNDRPPRNGTG